MFHSKTLSLFAAAVIAGFAVAGSANAATLSGLALDGSDQFQWPDAPLIGGQEQFDTSMSATSGRDVKDNRDQGQSFTITQTGTLDSVAFNFHAFSSSGTANFTWNFFKVVSATDSTMVGSVIDSLTVTASDLTNLGFSDDDKGTLVFDVVDTSVTADDVYAIQLDTDSGTDHIVKWRRDNSGYTGGEAFGNESVADDYYAAAYAVPEPASLAMGLFGLALIAGRRRR